LSDDIAGEAAASRLEEALERIAALAARPLPVAAVAVANPADSAEGSDVDVAAVTQRLDSLIAQLRGALAG
jgi:hypothetical protein